MKKCPNCHQENKQNVQYCTSCGEKMENELKNGEISSPVDLFIGKKADYYKEKWEKAEDKKGISFNGSAFLFSFLWLGYRKYYLPIVFIALGFLASDILIYLSGYQQSLTSISPIDRGISTTLGVVFGLYGNVLYKKFVQEQIEKINQSTKDELKREKLYAEKGQTSWFGVLIAILIIGFVYILPTSFIPLNTKPVEEVQLAEIEYVEGAETHQITVNQMFETIFDNSNWEDKSNSKIEEKSVHFEGDYEESHFNIVFQLRENVDYVEITEFSIDGEKKDIDADFRSFDFLLTLYLQRE